ncbi:Plasmodium exported protein, unknown function [Plasmodium vivax]|uniref:Uncharacterized protein n=1 Tax=Plasmodium vivax TaxID=5855 RepID=A0A565A6A8_PLAVI|nr:Plasmodium exported protein, unknown function [Plasmodium vivax]
MKGSNEYLVNEKNKFYFFIKLFTLIILTWICSYNYVVISIVILDNNSNKYGFSYTKINRLLAYDRLERELRSSGISSNTSHNRAHGNMKRAELGDTESEYTVKSKPYNKDVYKSLKERRKNSDYRSSYQKKKRSLIKKMDYHFEKKIFKVLDSIMQYKKSSKFDEYNFISFKNKKLRRITLPGTIILVLGFACMIAGKSTISYDKCDYCTGCIFYIAGTALLIMGLLIMIYISLKMYKYMEIQELKTRLSSKKN